MYLRAVSFLAVMALAAFACSAAQALPTATADVLPANTMMLCYAFVDEKPAGTTGPESTQVEIASVGVEGRTQIDLMRFEPEGRSGQYQLWARYQCVKETATRPALTLGAQDVTREKGDTAYYVAAAKTVVPAPGASAPYPVVRLYLGYRNDPAQGLMGGLRLRLCPRVMGLAFIDGRRDLYYVAYTLGGTPLTVYGGVWGQATFGAVAYRFSLPF
jgi:hypothetical protein